MKKIISLLLCSCVLFTASACLDDLPEGIILVPPSLKLIETEIITPSEKSDWNKDEFITAFRATKKTLSDEEFAQKYTAFYNYMPRKYSDEYHMDAFEVQQSDGDSIFFFYMRAHDQLYRIDPFATDTNADFNGFTQFCVSDLDANGEAEILVSYYYDGARLEKSYVHAIDACTGLSVEFDGGYYNTPVFFQKTDKGVALYKAKANDPTAATERICEVTKNTKKYVFHKPTFTVYATDYTAAVQIEEGTINFPIIADDMSLQFISRVKMIWQGESFGYTNSDTYLDGAFANYYSGEYALETMPWAAGDAITDFYIANGREIESEYYMVRLEEDFVGDFYAEVSYRFSENKLTEEKVFTIVEF